MRVIFTFLLSTLQDVQFNHTCPCFHYFQIPVLSARNESLSSLHQIITIIHIPLWSYPIESLLTGVAISLLARYGMKYRNKLLSHEKLGFVLNIIHKTQTSLTLIHNLLEEVATDGLPEPASKRIKRALGCTDHVIDCCRNVISFDEMLMKMHSDSWGIEFELYTYITLITNQCKTYANTRHIQLNINKNFGYISCRVHETTMTAALQCLIYKVIDITPPGGCINIAVSDATDGWNLEITNCPKHRRKYKRIVLLISGLMTVNCCGSLQIIKKVIRMHGGKITGHNFRRAVTFQVTVPADCHRNTKRGPVMGNSVAKSDKAICANEGNGIEKIKLPPGSGKVPHILLVMADKELSGYLNEKLSVSFRMTILEEPEEVFFFSGHKAPDVIIIDETVNGVCGDELCSRIKSNAEISHIPIILLIDSNDSKSYLSHSRCGADMLKQRIFNVCKLQADIQTFIKNHAAESEMIKRLTMGNPSTSFPETTTKDDGNILFMNKVQMILEKNLSAERYTVDMLSAEIGMSRTGFYNKMKDIIGEPPMDYIHAFKMNKARTLLITQQYNITEIATMIGYCDAKYFGKRFKEFYHVSPTRYVKEIMR